MKPLATTFTKNGFLFTQRQREGNIAIYGKRRANWKEGVETFEIVKISQNEAWVCHGKPMEAAEGYPSSESWGQSGFSETSFDRAKARLATLTLLEASKWSWCASVLVFPVCGWEAEGNRAGRRYGAVWWELGATGNVCYPCARKC